MNSLLSWLKSKNVSAHVIAVGIAGVAAAIVADQSLRDQVLVLFKNHPDIGTAIVSVSGIITTYLNFAKTQSK